MRTACYVLAFAGILTAFACGGGINPAAKPASVTSTPPAPPPPVVADFPAVLQAGDIQVSPVSVGVEKLSLVMLGSDATAQEEQFVLRVKLANTSTNKRCPFKGWPEAHNLLGVNCTATDEHNNNYKVVTFGIGSRPKEDAAGTTIDPGKEAIAVIPFEKPIDAAQVITVRLEGSAFGVDDKKLEWRITRAQWGG